MASSIAHKKRAYFSFAVISFLIFSFLGFTSFKGSKQSPVASLENDIEITESFLNASLNGHSVFVRTGGIALENLSGGDIIICEEVGAGTVTFKNCQNINVVVQSKATLLLDEKTSIQNLRIKDNARISSIKSIEDKYRTKKKSFSLFKPKKVDSQPEILNTEIDSDLQPLLEGGDFISVTENTDVSDKKPKKSKSSGALAITQDTSYTGNGVRLYIQNRPENAKSLNVIKKRNGVEEEIDWVSDSNKNSGRFFSEYYTYEFLNAGEQYAIRFDYFEGENKIESVSVDVVPEHGQEVAIDKKGISLFIDEDTGDFYWNHPPKSNLPSEAFLSYELDSQEGSEWHFVGLLRVPASENRKMNIYKDFDNIIANNVLGGKVYLHVYYEYDGFRWDVLRTSKFKFDS